MFKRIKAFFINEKVSVDVPPPEPATPGHQYASDQPIATRADDRFNRAPFATRMADTIATRVDPASIVIGLYGPWGDGKTSVLEMMEEALKAYPDVICVKFNPWHFQSEDQLLRGFFATLAGALNQSLPNFKERAGDALQQYGSLLSLGSLTVAGVLQINPGDAAKGLGESLSAVKLEELKQRIESILEKCGKRVVTFIDDIDRLDRNETHAIFKLVKLSASFRHTSYVLAFDDAVVSAALGERYGQGGERAGRAFLEKIIQVPLHLPPADEKSLRNLTFEGVQAALDQAEIPLTQSMADTFGRHFVDGLEPRLTTPRLGKLYANALTFALPLLKDEVDIVDLMLIEGIRIFYPNLYAEIRRNPDLFLKQAQAQNQNALGQAPQESPLDTLLIRSLPEATQQERLRVRRGLLEPLFPRIGRMGYGSEWDQTWARKQKACSSEYFARYFTYGIPHGDVGDAAIHSLLERLTRANDAERIELLTDFSSRGAFPKLVQKLRAHAEEISEEQAYALMVTLSANATLMPRERGPMVIGGTIMQGGMLVSELLRRIPDPDARQRAAEEVIEAANPLGFGMECCRWIHHHEGRHEDERVFSDAIEEILNQRLAHKICSADSERPLFVSDPKDMPSLYWLWNKHLGNTSVRKALTAHFEADPIGVDTFLECFVGEGWFVESGLPVRSDFERRSYDSVADLITPELIAENLRTRYGNALRDPVYHPEEHIPPALKTAHQFMYIHQQVLNGPEQNDPTPSSGVK